MKLLKRLSKSISLHVSLLCLVLETRFNKTNSKNLLKMKIINVTSMNSSKTKILLNISSSSLKELKDVILVLNHLTLINSKEKGSSALSLPMIQLLKKILLKTSSSSNLLEISLNIVTINSMTFLQELFKTQSINKAGLIL